MRSHSMFVLFLLFFAGTAFAQIPPSKKGVRPPDAYFQRLDRDTKAFTFSKGFIALVQHIQSNRARVATAVDPGFALAVANVQGGLVVAGTKSIPVAMALFPDMPSPPYPTSLLAQEFFDGPWPTGTISDFYSTMSYGNLAVKGSVFDWKMLSKPALYYAGDDYTDAFGTTQSCLGLCIGNRIGELIRELLGNYPGTDWGEYDNDGPDKHPNSGDDDGFVDFITIVHPGIGGECGGEGNKSIWSHRGQLDNEGGSYVTDSSSATPAKGKLRVNDYVIVPALACDGLHPNPIGVVAHEFGHAFALPDLYDVTYATNGGVGDWDLMATGAWGGDDSSPQTPSQMSAWSKAFLGWLTPIPVRSDISDIELEPIARKPVAYQIGNGPQYYLLSNRQKIGYDSLLPKSGLVLQIVDTTNLQKGWADNRVNVDPTALGLKVFEADGATHLIAPLQRADAARQSAGDVFPVNPAQRNLDNTSSPPTPGNFALCDIHQEGEIIHARLLINTTACQGTPGMTSIPSSAPGMQGHSSGNALNEPTILNLSATPERFAGQKVSLSGIIQNTGSNYFKNMHLSLTDQTGHSIPVQIDAPVELPPTAIGTKRPPPTLPISGYLGQQVIATGFVIQQEVEGEGKIYVLKLDKVNSLPAPPNP